MSKRQSKSNKAVENDDNPIEGVKVASRGETETTAQVDESPEAADVPTPDEVPEEEQPVVDEAPEEEAFKSNWNDAQKAHFASQDWSEGDTKRWFSVMNDPSAAYLGDSDVLAFDPKRDNRPASHWNTDELRAYMQGNLLHVKSHRSAELADEFRRRVAVDRAWSDEELFHHQRTGDEPAKTASGVWKNDVTRDKRKPGEWTEDELKAWAYNEIRTKIPSPRILEEINQRFDLTIPTHTNDKQRIRDIVSGDQARVENLTKKAEEGKLTRMNSTHIDTVLEQYIKAVQPGQEISTQTATVAQNNLERLFVYVTNLEGAAMVDGLDKIKDAVAKHRKGVFSSSNAHRFTHFVSGDTITKQRHIALLEMFIIITNPNKAMRKQTDAKEMLNAFNSPKLEQLTDYFRNYA